jgi:hypothetical protein
VTHRVRGAKCEPDAEVAGVRHGRSSKITRLGL